MEYLNDIFKGLWVLFRFGVIYFVYSVARKTTEDGTNSKWKSYSWTVAIVLGLTILSSTTIGTHVEDADPLFGGGEVVEDYEVSSHERIKQGFYLFTVLIIPALIGTHKGLSERVRSKIDPPPMN